MIQSIQTLGQIVRMFIATVLLSFPAPPGWAQEAPDEAPAGEETESTTFKYLQSADNH